MVMDTPPNPTPEPIPPQTTPAAPAPSQTQTPPPTEPLVYPTMAAVNGSPGQEAKEPEEKKNWVKTFALGVLNWLVVPAIIVLVLHNFVFQAFHVIGSSMVPTLHDTDYLIVSKLGATGGEAAKLLGQDKPYIPKHDEIIVFRYPQDPQLVFVKRVIGIPGDRVVVKDGSITVYNTENPKGYNPDEGTDRTKDPTQGEVDMVVPAGSVFVVGDNRTPNGSYDSREWGILPSSYIIGEAVMRLLPIDKVKILL